MSYVKIWVHCVWCTKNRTPDLTREVLAALLDHIRKNAKDKGLYIDIVNGYMEHIHCIILLRPDQTLARVVQLIKGESSFWINMKRLTRTRFEWGGEYYGASFGESDLNRVRLYIMNQKSHHSKKTWNEECNEMSEQYGFEKIQE